MQRARPVVLLTLLLLCGAFPAAGAQRTGGSDVDVTELVAVRNGVPARLCPGSDNALRVTIAWHGEVPSTATLLRVSLVLPGGPPGGALVAEGSIAGRPTVPVTTFTFLHIEISDRIRGRGARLVVRATLSDGVAEPNAANNVRDLAIDGATDWRCEPRRPTGR